MKKLFSVLLVILMLLCLVACGDAADTSSGAPETTTEPSETTTEPSETTTEPSETTTEPSEAEPVPMVGFILETEVYTTRFANGEDIHLEGLESGVYSAADRATSCGALPDGTKVQVLEVGFEGDDITVGWAKIMVGASKWQVYIRTSQLKCFVLHEVGFPIAPEQLIGQSRLVSGLSEGAKATIEASFLALGYRTAFMEDGSTMFISNENFEEQLVQNADGSWTEYDGQGGVNHYADFWQYELLSEYQIPTDHDLSEMKVALLGVSSSEGVVIRFAPSVTLENVKAYTAKAEALGYTLGLSKVENGGVYLFAASNENGYEMQLAYTAEGASMTVKKIIDLTFDLTEFIESGEIIAAYPSEKLAEFEKTITANGGKVEHRTRSTALVFANGTAEQFYDGSWLLDIEDVVSTTGDYFPSNTCTAQLMSVYPSTYGFKNEDTVFYKQSEEFLAVFSQGSVQNAKQFCSAVVGRGAFNLNVTENEATIGGVAVYSFYAESFDYYMEFACIDGQNATMKIAPIA